MHSHCTRRSPGLARSFSGSPASSSVRFSQSLVSNDEYRAKKKPHTRTSHILHGRSDNSALSPLLGTPVHARIDGIMSSSSSRLGAMTEPVNEFLWNQNVAAAMALSGRDMPEPML